VATKKQEADAGQAEAQKLVDQETERGYVGAKVDPVPDEEYSLQSGPDSPTAVPDDRTPIHRATLPREE
jgi:hypothetical protein